MVYENGISCKNGIMQKKISGKLSKRKVRIERDKF